MERKTNHIRTAEEVEASEALRAKMQAAGPGDVIQATPEEWKLLVQPFASPDESPPPAPEAQYNGPDGTVAKPARYALPDGREVLDVMFEEAEVQYYGEPGRGWRPVLRDPAMRAAICAAMAIKYELRKNEDPRKDEADRLKAAFYRKAQAFYEGKGPDPRAGRKA